MHIFSTQRFKQNYIHKKNTTTVIRNKYLPTIVYYCVDYKIIT